MKYKFIAMAMVAILLVGCDKAPTMPEVNAENCNIEKINKIKDKETKQNFAHLCSTRQIAVPKRTRPAPRWGIEGMVVEE
ncbi:MAG: entry exclusion lipoprotein TrbK [Candidatus Accumulibacter sp.]|jgi:entry exclusion lipoprotein TrbK|nr:entry exclusion lipoprotein TrbK [Accumulibacter sp.]